MSLNSNSGNKASAKKGKKGGKKQMIPLGHMGNHLQKWVSMSLLLLSLFNPLILNQDTSET